jgi:hypothetical protein
VAYDDLTAIAALHAAHRVGWTVPEQLSVVGLDDIELAEYTAPALTTVAQPMVELGARSAPSSAPHGGAPRTPCSRASSSRGHDRGGPCNPRQQRPVTRPGSSSAASAGLLQVAVDFLAMRSSIASFTGVTRPCAEGPRPSLARGRW